MVLLKSLFPIFFSSYVPTSFISWYICLNFSEKIGFAARIQTFVCITKCITERNMYHKTENVIRNNDFTSVSVYRKSICCCYSVKNTCVKVDLFWHYVLDKGQKISKSSFSCLQFSQRTNKKIFVQNLKWVK